jgi:carbon-monoxide dehydrogenase small subunit
MTRAGTPRRPGRRRAASPATGRVRLTLSVNGEPHDVAFDGYKTLLEVLREDLGLAGTKHGCELGECGTCAVLVDGRPVLSCLLLGVECDGAEVTTIEGLARGPELHPLQAAFADQGGAQCGYCTPGIILTAAHLLARRPDPTRAEIAEALSGNLCRCTGYLQIFEAVEAAARELAATAGREAPAGSSVREGAA